MLFFTSSNFVLKAPGCGGGRVVNVFRVGLLFLLGCQWLQLVAASSANVMSGSVSGNERRGGYDIPIQVTRRKTEVGMKRRGDVSGTTGMGNNADLLYSIPIGLGEASDEASYYVSAVNLDTGSSDLWVVSDACQTGSCAGSSVNRYPSKRVKGTQTPLQLQYGDSTTGTFANGVLGRDTAVVAGLAMTDQAFGVISSTNNPIVKFGTAGIFGLGFPSGSKVQQAAVVADTPKATTDDFLHSTYQDGPLITRLSASGALQMPQFSITLARNTIDIGGNGMLTIGKLPDGIDNSSLTWVPVRLYKSTDGGLNPPNFAPNELYPYRWEIDIDGVFLDGKKVADSTIPANGVNPGRVTALIDTGNSLIRGPSDMVNSILTTVSPGYNPSSTNKPTLPCAVPHTMAFQIGGKMFPVDPRDFIGASMPNDATTCVADNLVSTDPPSYGALFSWSLGDPFMKSNLVAFHYGNITHPSVDPPRIGFLSLVPNNADDLLRQAVADAQKNGGNFEETLAVAPTASAETASQTTIAATSTPLPSPSSGSNNATPSRIITVTMQSQPTDAGADAAPSTTSVTNDNAAMANLGLGPGWTSLWLGIVLVARFLV